MRTKDVRSLDVASVDDEMEDADCAVVVTKDVELEKCQASGDIGSEVELMLLSFGSSMVAKVAAAVATTAAAPNANSIATEARRATH